MELNPSATSPTEPDSFAKTIAWAFAVNPGPIPTNVPPGPLATQLWVALPRRSGL
jgi:hypothetical protein